MKKAFTLLLALVMSLSLLTACGGKEDPAPETDPDPVEDGETSEDTLPGEGMKIALVCDKVDTQDSLVQMVNALNECAEKYGFEATIAERADTATFEDIMRALVAEEYDLIIGGSRNADDAIVKIATEKPDGSNYVLIDSAVDADAVKCISYREQEGAYLIGQLAALVTDGESHTYGAIHCFEGPGSWKLRYGFQEGVKSLDPEATFIFNYTDSFSDPAKAKELAIQQHEQGCMFVNSAAANGDSGIFEAAKEKGFFTSGQDIDLTNHVNPYIVSSQIKDSYQTIWNLIDEFFSGSYTAEDAAWGLSEDTIGVVHVTHESKAPINERLSAEDLEVLKKSAEDIKTGVLDLRNIPTEEAYNAQ